MQRCRLCKVVIHEETVYFSYGEPGTKARLQARVCQYAKEKGCINDFQGFTNQKDEFKMPKGLHFDGTKSMDFDDISC